MVTTFAIIISLFLVLIIYKKLNNRYQEEKFKIRMHRLRNELRNLAIEKKVNCHSQEFDFVDYTISKTIQESYYYTLFYLTMLGVKHSKVKSDVEHYRKVYDNLIEKVVSNEDLKGIMEKRHKVIRNYVLSQNKITIFIITKLLSILMSITKFKRFIKRTISYTDYLPEVSGVV